jgi:hypothetical protein
VRDHDYSASIDFLARFFAGTEHAVEIRALPVEAGAGRVWPLFTREPDLVTAHCLRWDALGRAVYFGCATRAGGLARGDRTHCRELVAVWVDIDCYKQGITKEEAVAALLALPIPPSVIIDSGGGIRGYWLLRERIDISQGPRMASDRAARRLGAKATGRCPGRRSAVCDLRADHAPARHHNTKDGTCGCARPAVLDMGRGRRRPGGHARCTTAAAAPVEHAAGGGARQPVSRRRRAFPSSGRSTWTPAGNDRPSPDPAQAALTRCSVGVPGEKRRPDNEIASILVARATVPPRPLAQYWNWVAKKRNPGFHRKGKIRRRGSANTTMPPWSSCAPREVGYHRSHCRTTKQPIPTARRSVR